MYLLFTCKRCIKRIANLDPFFPKFETKGQPLTIGSFAELFITSYSMLLLSAILLIV